MSLLGIIRKVCFILGCIFAAIVVALSVHIIVFTEVTLPHDFESEFDIGFAPSYPPFAALGIATGVLTLMTLPTYLIVDSVRKGAWTSMIFVEMITLTILWVMWLATASLSASQATSPTSLVVTFGQCSDYSGYPAGETACNEAKAVEAMAFLAFVTLLIYAFLLLVFTLIASARGHSIWMSPVKGTNFFAPSIVPPPAEPAPQMAAQYAPTFAPQPQMYTPGGVPQPVYPGYQAGSPVPQFTGAPMMTPQLTGSPILAPQHTGSPMMAPQPGLPMQPGAQFQGPPPGAYQQTPPPAQV